ncbi:MAG: tRNA1(Val) (adenine(37)-N6)-methyltransferase [Clostridia bacterium]|nr:tRNA1(Val) (adenine(37)-N6)-methyltransferase [Clostridia bacterium]
MNNIRFDLIKENGYGIYQNVDWFSYGIDAVLVSHFANVKKNQTVVDLGTGNGIIPLLLNIKHPHTTYYGVEKQIEVIELAQRSLKKNKIDNIHIIHSDINHVFNHLKKSSVNVVISNPPYFKKGDALINNDDVKAHARHETTGNLEDFIRTASELLVEKGHFYMVHRPMRLVDIFYYCRKYKLEPKLVQFVYPHHDKVPNIVLVKCIKNGNSELKYGDNLYVYDEDRNYTKAIYEIYENVGIDVF